MARNTSNRARIVSSERRNNPAALLLFGAAYAFVLVVILAPRGTL
jgi:hypothetical protein